MQPITQRNTISPCASEEMWTIMGFKELNIEQKNYAEFSGGDTSDIAKATNGESWCATRSQSWCNTICQQWCKGPGMA